MKNSYRQPWLGKPFIDIVFILLPPFVSLIFIFLFPASFQNNKNIPDNWWVIVVLLVDVAHVYSTLYRTYFNKQLYKTQRSILYLIPILGFAAAYLVYNFDALIFWRLLAYLAVYHFVRQQYGFMRLYSRKENHPRWMNVIDKWTIYYATLYPLLYWHLSGPRNFNWFIEGDFVKFNSSSLLICATVLYGFTLAAYVTMELISIRKNKALNIPKAGVITGTIVSWYFGIVYFNGDMAFTILNVVSHGIPYMALIWIYGKKQSQPGRGRMLSVFFGKYGIVLFLGLIFLLAYIEEGLWDSAVWKEHTRIFNIFHHTGIEWNSGILNVVVPLLALPQITHYIIDGFIWKVRNKQAL